MSAAKNVGGTAGVIVKIVTDDVLIPRDVAQRERERGVFRLRLASFRYSGELPERFRRPVGSFRVYDATGKLIGIGIVEWRTLYVPPGLPNEVLETMRREFAIYATNSMDAVKYDILELALAIAAALGVEGVEGNEEGIRVDGEPLEELLNKPSGLLKLRTKMCQAVRRVAEQTHGDVPEIILQLKKTKIVC